MHLLGSDLDFNGLAVWPQHHRMNRLITVRFRVGDVVIELVRHMAIMGVHNTECCVAILQTFSHHAHGTHIEQLIKGEGFLLHLAPDAVDVFRAAINFSLNTLFFHRFAQCADKIVDVMLTVDTTLMQQFRDSFVFIRMQVAEAVVFQLPFELANAETVSERCINIGALFCRQNAFVLRCVFDFAQMSNSLRQFNDHAAEIVHHCQ